MNIKIKKMKKLFETPPEKNDSIKSKISEGMTEEGVIISLFAKNKSRKLIKADILSIDTYKKYMIADGCQKKRNKNKTNGIISIRCPCNHCWGLIIVCPYHIWLKVIFVLKKQNNVLMSFPLDILLIPI